MTEQPDTVDKKILTILQEEGSISNADLAKKIFLSPSATLTRVKRLKETGIISKVSAIVNEEVLGLETITMLFISLSPHNREITEAFIEKVNDTPQILECYNISGEFDFLLKIISPSLKKYREFVIDTLLEFPGVGKVESQIVLSTVKRTSSLPLDDVTLWKNE